jgi:hypothetical protein
VAIPSPVSPGSPLVNFANKAEAAAGLTDESKPEAVMLKAPSVKILVVPKGVLVLGGESFSWNVNVTLAAEAAMARAAQPKVTAICLVFILPLFVFNDAGAIEHFVEQLLVS